MSPKVCGSERSTVDWDTDIIPGKFFQVVATLFLVSWDCHSICSMTTIRYFDGIEDQMLPFNLAHLTAISSDLCGLGGQKPFQTELVFISKAGIIALENLNCTSTTDL